MRSSWSMTWTGSTPKWKSNSPPRRPASASIDRACGEAEFAAAAWAADVDPERSGTRSNRQASRVRSSPWQSRRRPCPRRRSGPHACRPHWNHCPAPLTVAWGSGPCHPPVGWMVNQSCVLTDAALSRWTGELRGLEGTRRPDFPRPPHGLPTSPRTHSCHTRPRRVSGPSWPCGRSWRH